MQISDVAGRLWLVHKTEGPHPRTASARGFGEYDKDL